jgi:predicted hydrocarbon binding protein
MFKIILELLAHKQLKFEEGYIILFDQSGLMVPVITLVEIQKLLEKIEKENIFYYGAKSSGAEWIRRIFKLYKMDTIEEQANWGEKTFTLAGNGKMKVIKWDVKKSTMIYRVYESAISKVYGKTDHAVDQIPRGWFAGASCIFFNKDVDAVEVKCMAKGDEYCEFIVKPKTEFDFRNKEIKRQLKSV